MEAAKRSAVSGTLEQARPPRVFETDLFEEYVARLVRRHLVAQYVDEGHEVLQEELRLLELSRRDLVSHLERTQPEWHLTWRLAKFVVVQHVRQLAYERLCLHDVDDDTRDETLERVYKEDLEALFPKTWSDA